MNTGNLSIKILFVCLGNICRSPAAEEIARVKLSQMLEGQSLFIDSAGIINFHEGKSADARMIHHARERGYHLKSVSRPVQIDDFEQFDFILAMDNRNFLDLIELCPREEYRAKIMKLCSFISSDSDFSKYSEVPDPYYGGSEGFELVIDILESSMSGLGQFIQKKGLS